MMTFERVVGLWMKEKTVMVRRDKLSSKTLRNYKDMVEHHFIPYFKNVYITDIDKDTVKQFIAYFKSKLLLHNGKLAPPSDASVDTSKTILKGIMNYAVKNGYVDENPVDKNLSHSKRIIPSLTDDEIERILSVARIHAFLMPSNKKEKASFYLNTAYYIALELTIATGIAKKELFALYWNDLEDDVLSINASVLLMGKNTTIRENDTVREIHLDKRTLLLLKKWKSYQSEILDTPLIFSNAGGHIIDPSNMTNRWWKDVRKEAGFANLRWQDVTKLNYDRSK